MRCVVNQENRTHDLEVNKFKTHTDVPDVEISRVI